MVEREWKVKPFPGDEINDEALQIHGLTREAIATFDDPMKAHSEFVAMLGKYVDKYSRADKFYPAGYNVRFDLEFLSVWFLKCGDAYFGSWQNWRALDPLPYLYTLDFSGVLILANYKLGTVAEHYGVEIQAHDALSDVRAAREILNRVVLSPATVPEPAEESDLSF
jgi:DNA polymerase III subunit epsilon